MNIVRMLCKEMAEIFNEIGKLPDDVEPDDGIDVVMNAIEYDIDSLKKSISWLVEKYGEKSESENENDTHEKTD